VCGKRNFGVRERVDSANFRRCASKLPILEAAARRLNSLKILQYVLHRT